MSPMEELEQALCHLQAEDVVALAPVEALVRSERLHRAASLLHLLRLQSVADVDARSLHELAGCPTTASWLAGMDADYDRREVALAKKLTSLPLVSAEIAAGRLGMTVGKVLQTALSMLRHKVDRPDGLIDGMPGEVAVENLVLTGVRQVIAECRGGLTEEELWRLSDRLRLIVLAPSGTGPVSEAEDGSVCGPVCGPSQHERLEAAFLTVAQWIEPHQLRSAVGLLVAALLPRELEAAAERARAERGLVLERRGSGWRLEGDLDLETGELLYTVLDAEMRRDEQNVADTAAAAAMREEGLDPSDPDDRAHVRTLLRSRRHRMHDALHNGLSRYLGAALGGVADKVAVHMSVSVGVDQLAQAPGTLPGRAASGAPLPLRLVQRLSCDTSLVRFVMSLQGRAIEASHTERTTKAHERRAKYLETGGWCQCRGCRGARGTPGMVLTPHHVYPYAVHGRTSHDETVLLCPASHHDLHEGGKTIRLRDGRWLSAEGWVTGRPSGAAPGPATRRPPGTGPPGEVAA